MNKKQKIVLIAMVLIISAMCVYPPFVITINAATHENIHKYSLICNPPRYQYQIKQEQKGGMTLAELRKSKNIKIEERGQTNIDYGRLLIQMIPIVLISICAFWLTKRKT